ncbi:MAG TPA: tetratricopeptide repeat protein [Gemmatimonas sp.]|nr:tetratricopeptide repeat protein [Gemmatimonas sp.]
MTSTAPVGRDVDVLRAFVDRIDQQDPGAFNNLGVLFFSKGLLRESIDAFLRALSLDPRMRTAARNLEIAAAQPGACDAQIAALDVRLADDGADVDSRRERARLLRLIGRHADAAAALDGIIAENPDDAVALFERGLLEQRAGDLRRAQKWFERAVNASPADPTPRLHLAEVLYQRGQNEQSLEALDALLEGSPNVAEAHLLRGFVLGDLGFHEEALAAARHASTLNPSLAALQPDLSLDGLTVDTPLGGTAPDVLAFVASSGLARYGLGLAFRQRGYFTEARREFERALEQGEDDRLTRHAIAELDLITGDHDAARATYESLLMEQPEHARHWNEHGVALHQSGDLDGAAGSYRRALQADPRNAIAYNNLGVVLADSGEGVAAREALVRAAELDPSLVCARLNLARWFVRQRDPLAALGTLRELVAFHPEHADAWHEMGLALGALHRPAEARDAFLKAIERRSAHAEARYALAEVLATLGDQDGALRETQFALGLASMRAASRLTVWIDLQHECPEAVGPLDLLSLQGGVPLAGISLSDDEVLGLLPDLELQPTGTQSTALVDGAMQCDVADDFASRGLHGEALERYADTRAALDALECMPGTPEDVLWRRAASGEARSRCLLGDGGTALPLLQALGARTPHDPETLALFAYSAAHATQRGEPRGESARNAMLRILRIETPSAAIMHFVGDAALMIADETLALVLYRRALALDPTRPSPRVAIARLLRHRGDLLAARLELVAALASRPGWGEALVELARVHRDARRPMDALEVLARYLADNPMDTDALVLLAEVLVLAERNDDARVAVSRVLRHAPSDTGALWIDGVLLERQGRQRDARRRWREAVDTGAQDAFTTRARAALGIVDVEIVRGTTTQRLAGVA